jgi:hypothetical protein
MADEVKKNSIFTAPGDKISRQYAEKAKIYQSRCNDIYNNGLKKAVDSI